MYAIARFVPKSGAAATGWLQGLQNPGNEQRATRMAAQAAAGALGSVVGAGGCADFVMCAEARPAEGPGAEEGSGRGGLDVAANLFLC